MRYKLIATTVFGLEAVAAYEIKTLNFENIVIENGRVIFETDEAGIVKANMWLRCVERIFVLVGTFEATTFEQLFDEVNGLPWEQYLPENANFPVNAKSVNSTLFSLSDIQKISKKAIAKRMSSTYGVEWLEETGSKFDILISILKDQVIVAIDTSGEGLHKRGYRARGNEAPMKETLAAGLLYVARWKPEIPLIDPMCGSGTIAIEAAMIAKNIAPGLHRKFASENWSIIDPAIWKAERKEAYTKINQEVKISIKGYDMDPTSITIAKANAELAGVEDCITFETRAVEQFNTFERNGYIICNPPYGERLSDVRGIEKLYAAMGVAFKKYTTWSKFIITSYENFEIAFGSRADKNRKLYNGRIKTYFYQYTPGDKADKPVERSTGKYSNKPQERSGERPGRKFGDKPGEKSGKPGERPARKFGDKPSRSENSNSKWSNKK